ncbi:hypothetical protein ACFE04_001807 [Oxalis oulophora]
MEIVDQRESVIVVMDSNRSRGFVEALDWGLKHVVKPGDRVVLLGVLCCDSGKKITTSSCFPINIGGIVISNRWEKIELAGEVRPRQVLEKKKEIYQSILQPFCRQCKKNEVKLEIRLYAGYCPVQIVVHEAQNSKPRWIVLDSNFKKFKLSIYEHIGCNLAVLKGNDVATVITSQDTENSPIISNTKTDGAPLKTSTKTETLLNGCFVATLCSDKYYAKNHEGESSTSVPPKFPHWDMLSQKKGYPRAFIRSEIEEITNNFAKENVVVDAENTKAYEGIFQGSPVLVKPFLENDNSFWSMLKILLQTRHRNITNLVGYCCDNTCMCLLFDNLCVNTLHMALQCDDKARKLSWKRRWHIALEIGGSLRYLHEESAGVIAHLSVCSSHVYLFHGLVCSAMLGNFRTASWLKDNTMHEDDSPRVKRANLAEEEFLSIDIHDYGMFLIELISGKTCSFQNRSEGYSLIDWALPLLEDGLLSEVMDFRLMDSDDVAVVSYMARAALLCLKNKTGGHRIFMSKVLAMVRGEQLA